MQSTWTIPESSVDPAPVADAVQIYAKDVAGITQFFARASDGTVFQLSNIGGGGAGPLFDTVITHAFTGGNFTHFDNVNFGSLGDVTYIKYTTDGLTMILDGIAGGVDGKVICLQETSLTGGLLVANMTSGTPANQMIVSTGASSVQIPYGGNTWFRYDGSISKWRNCGGPF